MQARFGQQTSATAAANPAAVEPSVFAPTPRINPKLKPELILLGQSQTPLIVIDDLVENLPELLAYAAVQNFQQDRDSYYPGVRALLPRNYVKAVLDALFPLLYQQYQLSANLRL